MATVSTSAVTTPNTSTTGTLKRDVSDTIRHLWSGTPFLRLVAKGKIPKDRDLIKSKSMIGKRRVEKPKFECFYFAPLAVEFTATSLSGTTLVLSSTTGLRAKYSLVNTKNRTVCNIDSITNTTTCEVTSVGATSFSVSANDILLLIGCRYEEYSSSPAILMKDPTNLYNLTYIARYPFAMSGSAKNNPHYGGNRWEQYKKENATQGLRLTNYSLYFDERPSGTSESNTSGAGHSFRTCRGLWNWAQVEHDFGGAASFEAFMQDASNATHESVGPHHKKVMVCGNRVWTIILGWINDKLIVDQGKGSYEKFGVESRKVLWGKGHVEVMLDDTFDHGDFAKHSLIFDPDTVNYVHLRDRDFGQRGNIQNNDVDGTMEEILGEVSIDVEKGGYDIMQLKNWY